MPSIKRVIYSFALSLVALVSVLAAPGAIAQTPAQALSFSQTWPSRPFNPGQQVNGVFTITNIGTAAATNVSINETITAGMFSSVSWTC